MTVPPNWLNRVWRHPWSNCWVQGICIRHRPCPTTSCCSVWKLSISSLDETQTGRNAQAALQDEGGDVLVPDYLFVPDNARVVGAPLRLQPHESPYPPPWGELSARLQRWMSPKSIAAAAGGPDHAKHPFMSLTAGGVESRSGWSRLLMRIRTGVIFKSVPKPPNDRGAGQRLSLYLGNHLDQPIARWWLRPAIRSTAIRHEQYASILARIGQRYGIGRLIVSSLVGHSLDIYDSQLPCIQVLHDFYPCGLFLASIPILSHDRQPG